MNKRITLRDLAAKLGLHYTTVSLALRNHSQISESTRLKVQQLAREMGYVPDPMVSALSVYRQTLRSPGFHSTLAWLTNSPEALVNPNYPFIEQFNGAQHRAAELGYQIEELPFRSPGMTAGRYVRMLQARGIQGILVPPQPTHRMSGRIRMDWSGFSSVALGHTLAWPPLHRVASNHFQSAQLAVRELRKRGYQRIGLCISRLFNRRVLSAWSGGYFAEMQRKGAFIEPLLYDRFQLDQLRKWISQYRLDSVISHGATHHIQMSGFWQIPEGLGLVELDRKSNSNSLTGIDQDYFRIGQIAINQLVSLINLGEKGIPAVPGWLGVNGTWVPGATVRRLNPA